MKTDNTTLQDVLEKLNSIDYTLLSQKAHLTMKELCTYLSISESFAYKLTSGGIIPHYKPSGKLIYFKREEIDTWLLSNRIKTQIEMEKEANEYVKNHRKK